MSKVCVFDHPLIQHKLSVLRDKNTSVKVFRELISEIAMLMCYEATRDLPLEEVEVETPVAVAKCRRIAGKKLAVVPILRAGLGMVDGMVSMMPNVKVGHVGLFRDPVTLEPVKYYFKMPPDIQERDIIVVDPMLATGGSASAAITFLKETGGRGADAEGSPRCGHLCGRPGRKAERPRLHRPRPGRRRRPHLRHQVNNLPPYPKSIRRQLF